MSRRDVLTALFSVCILAGCILDSNGDPRSMTVRGTLVDEDGDALGGVVVSIVGDAGAFTDTTDAEGRYGFDGVVAGEWLITPRADGLTFMPAGVALTVGGHDMDLAPMTGVTNDARAVDIPAGILEGEGGEADGPSWFGDDRATLISI